MASVFARLDIKHSPQHMFIAKPPSNEEKYRYINANGLLFSIPGFLLLIAFSASSFFFIRKSLFLIPYSVFCLIYVLNLGFSAFGALHSKYFEVEEHNKLKEQNKDFEPSVDIYLPNCGEDIAVLANTFKAVAQLDYTNHKAWVLDDAGRDAVRILAELHGFEYVTRKNKGYLKKAGNMRNAFAFTTGEFILVFDADFVPRVDFLRETIFYMQDESIGILQTPQYFQITPEQSAIQKGATYVQEVFHRLIQNFRNEWNSSVCTGSCAIYRRAALKPFGGAYPVSRSEDVHTGLATMSVGYQIKYVPLVLSAGLSPDTIKSAVMQTYRWCGGSLRLITSSFFWTLEKVSPSKKLSYCLSIFYYLVSGLGAIVFNLPSIINVWFFPQDFTVSNYSLIVPALIACLLMRGLWGTNKWSFDVVFTSFVSSYANLTSIIDVITNNSAPWVPTGSAGASKERNYERFKTYVKVIPAVNFGLFIAGIIVNFHEFNVSYWQLIPPTIWFSVQLVLQQILLRQIRREEN